MRSRLTLRSGFACALVLGCGGGAGSAPPQDVSRASDLSPFDAAPEVGGDAALPPELDAPPSGDVAETDVALDARDAQDAALDAPRDAPPPEDVPRDLSPADRAQEASVDAALDARGASDVALDVPSDLPRDDPPPEDAPRDAGADVTVITACQKRCASVADCAMAPVGGAFDAPNYACERGICRYTGCRADAECAVTFRSTLYVCRDVPGGLAACVHGCTTAADCASLPVGGAFDAANYACERGACRYTGCRADAECALSFRESAFVCRSSDGALPSCVHSCATQTDCATAPVGGAFDAPNYACERGACRYTGCRADAECAASFRSVEYVCR